MKSEVLRRIPKIVDWDNFLQQVSKSLVLGNLVEWSVIEAGLEDTNIRLSTDAGDFLFKAFASSRTQAEIDRYEEIFEVISANNIPHPKLIQRYGRYVHELEGVQFSIYEWVDGKTFYELGRVPNNSELSKIVAVAARINKLPIKPTFIHDSWAVYNLPKLFADYKDKLEVSDRKLIQKAVLVFNDVNHQALPRAFVHGDITQQNLVLSKDKEIFLVDFGVANYYPRIQELALIVALLMDKGVPVQLRITWLVSEYEKQIKLTDVEKKSIFPYVVASQAMEILGVYRERAKGSTLKELDYWIDIGRKGLKRSFSDG